MLLHPGRKLATAEDLVKFGSPAQKNMSEMSAALHQLRVLRDIPVKQ